METRASYMVVGSFTILIVVGALLFVLWSAKNDKGEQRRYRIEFHQSVSGLSVGSSVMLEGVRIGQVNRIQVSPVDPGVVYVLVTVSAEAPIRQNSEATLEPQGVTGVTAVAISGGSKESPLLASVDNGEIPIIPSRISSLQQIMNSVPQILSSVDEMVKRANRLLSPETTEGFGRMLTSLADVSDTLAANKDSLSDGFKGFGEAGKSFASVGKRLEKLTTEAHSILSKDVRGAFSSLGQAATKLDTTIGAAGPGLQRFSRDSVDELHRLLVEARRLMANLADLSQKIESDPRRFLLGNPVPEFSVP